MNDEFFSLDSLLSDSYCEALDGGRWTYAQWLFVLRCAISRENNQ